MRLCEGLYLVGSGQFGLSSPLDCHSYLVDCGGEYVLIDPGSGDEQNHASRKRVMAEDGLSYSKISHILLTHYHCDHSGGAAGVRAETGAAVHIAAVEANYVTRGTREELALDWYPADYRYTHTEVDRIFTEPKEEILVGNVRFLCLATPGHSKGGRCYLAEVNGRRLLFSGDTVYVGGFLGLLNFEGSDLADYRASISRLAGLCVDALLPGHLMFTLRNGQAHLDKAISDLTQNLFVPYSVGQLGLWF